MAIKLLFLLNWFFKRLLRKREKSLLFASLGKLIFQNTDLSTKNYNNK